MNKDEIIKLLRPKDEEKFTIVDWKVSSGYHAKNAILNCYEIIKEQFDEATAKDWIRGLLVDTIEYYKILS